MRPAETLIGLAAVGLVLLASHSIGSATSRGAVSLLGSDPYLQSYFGNSKAKAVSSDSWRQKVLSGSLFTNLGGIEASDKQANRQRRQKELASALAAHKKDVQVVGARAQKASDSKSALDGMEAMVNAHMQATRALEDSKVKSIGLGGHVDVGALRAHARKNEVKYAGKEGMVHYHRALPAFNNQVTALEKSLGEAHGRRGSVSRHTAAKSAGANGVHTKFLNADGAIGQQLSQLSKELAHEKHAAQASAAREKARENKAWQEGARKAVRVEDQYSRSTTDMRQGARGSMDRVVTQFSRAA